jgi:glycosyltransferase involved in cell wall biosynthesis
MSSTSSEGSKGPQAPAAPAGEPLRVLVVIRRYPPGFSGAAQQQHHVSQELAGRVRVTVLTLGAPGLPGREFIDGVEVVRLGSSETGRRGRAVYVLGVLLHLLLHGRRYAAVHSYAAGWAAFLIPLLARPLGLGTMYSSTLQGSDDAASVLRQGLGALKLRLLRMYDRVSCCTPAQCRAFTGYGFADDATVTLTCGVDHRFLSPAPDDACRRELRREAGRDDDGPVILFIGTLTERKGVDLLVEAFRGLLGSEPGAVLVLMGPKNRNEDATLDERFVERLVETCNTGELAGHVLLLGRVDSVERKRSVLRAADVFALFSRAEGLGIVILEAMACGVPPVLTPLPGVFDFVVDDGRTGRIAGSRDAAELTALLAESLRPEQNRRLAECARGEIERRFSVQVVAERYLEQYRALARGSTS